MNFGPQTKLAGFAHSEGRLHPGPEQKPAQNPQHKSNIFCANVCTL